MKYKLFTGIVAASLLAVSCNNDKEQGKADKGDSSTATKEKEIPKPEVKPKPEPKPEVKPKPEVVGTAVSKSVSAVAKVFDGEKYVSTQITPKAEYFLLYITASW